MQTNIHVKFIDSEDGQSAQKILTNCVHCGFCTATCPTYQLLGDERDGPRGRIYLIKQLLETGHATEKTRRHVDQCLQCRACETTCPSGVEYSKLLDFAREIIDQQQTRPLKDRAIRWGIRQIVPYPKRFGRALAIGQFFRPLFPYRIKRKIPAPAVITAWPSVTKPRTMIALAGCAQPSATPNTNAAAARVLDRFGITLTEMSKAGCCGAVDYHLSAKEQGLAAMRRNIDAWWPSVEQGAEAIVMTASGCGSMVKDYGELLRNDADYSDKAKKISELTKDLTQVLLNEDVSKLALQANSQKTAIHCPCSLQHAQQLPDALLTLLSDAGVELADTQDSHLCCGSAGSYSILQPKIAQQLLDKKITALSIDQPDNIVTANVGCQLHLATKADVPVMHWIELVDQMLPPLSAHSK